MAAKTKIGGLEFDFDQAFATAVLATIGVSIVGSLAGLWGYRKAEEEVEVLKKQVTESIPFRLPGFSGTNGGNGAAYSRRTLIREDVPVWPIRRRRL